MATGRTVPASDLLLLFAVVLFGAAVGAGSGAGAILAVVATLALALSLASRSSQGTFRYDDSKDGNRAWERRLLFAVLLFAVMGALGWSPSAIGPTSTALERMPGVVWAVLALSIYVSGRRGEQITAKVVTVLTLVFTLIVGLLHIGAASGLGLDVYLLHIEAAEALVDGQNPYTDAVEVPDGAPTAAPGQVITGYPYPPVAGVAYALGHWTLSDARYTSLLAWVTLLALIGVAGVRNRRHDHLYLMLLLASLPGWPLVLRAAWTEPLSLALMAVAFFTWKRPRGSGVALGLGLASKQYFLVTAPLVLLHRQAGWKRRLSLAAAMIGVTLGVALVWDAGAFWSAAVEFHTSTPPRIDSSNLVGLLASLGIDWDPPAVIALGVGLLTALIAGRYALDRTSFMLGMGLALAASFLVSSQAFSNFWLLVAGIGVLALHDSGSETAPLSAEGSGASNSL